LRRIQPPATKFYVIWPSCFLAQKPRGVYGAGPLCATTLVRYVRQHVDLSLAARVEDQAGRTKRAGLNRRALGPFQLVLFVSLTFFTGAAYAVDRGQFENVPDDVRTWFKGVRSPAGVPCCDISDGHRTEYDVRAGAYWVPINGLWWQVPEKAIIRNAGNPLGEAVVWYVSLRGNIEIRCFVPADAA
jgi:hypothetical protein